MAGSYPALFLSRFTPERVLKDTILPSRRGGLYRILIVTQLTVAILLLIAILILRQQIAFAQSKDLGFKKEQIVVIPNWSRDLVGTSYASLRNEIL